MERSYKMSQEAAREYEREIDEEFAAYGVPSECYALVFKNWGHWSGYHSRIITIRKKHTHRPRRARATWQGRWNRSSSLKGYYKNMKRFDT